MKQALLCLFLLISISFANPVFAGGGERFVTSLGSGFDRVNFADFGRAWKDPGGLIWSDAMPGLYDNLSEDGFPPVDGIIQKSHAIEICMMQGGRLPTAAEYASLQNYFATEETQDNQILVMTKRGTSDLHYLFPMLEGRTFWTTTIMNDLWAYAFSGSNGYVGDWSMAALGCPMSVQCVSKGVKRP